MRKTKIICTIGPSSEEESKLKELMKAGMNVARLNFSHDTHEIQGMKYKKVIKVSEELGLPIATLLDTRGPEIRLGVFEDGRTELVSGQTFTITTRELLGNNEIVEVSYKDLVRDVEIGSKILIDDGLIEMIVTELTETDIICKVLNGGPVSNRKGVNVPGVVLSMPFINDSDRRDIEFGAEIGFDFIAASFTRTKDDILQIRKILDAHKSKMKIIAKIENMQGIQNIDEILEVSDGIMVARGDMGVEIPMEEVPIIQKSLIKKAVAVGKHVITATQMLESMIKNPRPTRAEATDVANAIYDGTTAIMLSGESASGKYPVEAVKTMDRIACRTEADIDYKGRFKKVSDKDSISISTAIAHTCCSTAMDLKAAAIITVTMSGFTAGLISKYKPNCPIIGCTVTADVRRQLNLMWGVTPVLINKKEDSEELCAEAISAAVREGIVKKGDTVVITAGLPLGISGMTNMIRVMEV